MRIHINSLPRSGSTLLCSILAQNPSIHVPSATSGCAPVLAQIKAFWPTMVEHKAEEDTSEKLKRTLSAVYQAYEPTKKPVCVDKGRGWAANFETLKWLDPKAKIIVGVRDIVEILASFEKLYRKTTQKAFWRFRPEDQQLSQTLEGRCEIWMRQNEVVGRTYVQIHDLLVRGHGEDVLLVDFDDFVTNPHQNMERIYAFYKLKPYKHNFKCVKQVTQEDDENAHGIPNLHTIRTCVKPVPRVAEHVLTPTLIKKYSGLEFWRQK